MQVPDFVYGDPRGIRTPVTGVRGRRPKPLDDGTIYKNSGLIIEKIFFCQTVIY